MPKKHHGDLASLACAGAQSNGEHLAILARQLALNHVFETFDDIINAICDAWNRLIAQHKFITSIGVREPAHVGQTPQPLD